MWSILSICNMIIDGKRYAFDCVLQIWLTYSWIVKKYSWTWVWFAQWWSTTKLLIDDIERATIIFHWMKQLESSHNNSNKHFISLRLRSINVGFTDGCVDGSLSASVINNHTRIVVEYKPSGNSRSLICGKKLNDVSSRGNVWLIYWWWWWWWSLLNRLPLWWWLCSLCRWSGDESRTQHDWLPITQLDLSNWVQWHLSIHLQL
jgi:hypothetical protein